MLHKYYKKHGRALFPHFHLIRAVEQKIHGNIVEIRKLDQDFSGDIQFAAFIVAVNALAASQNFAHLHLRQVMIFPQFADSLI